MALRGKNPKKARPARPRIAVFGPAGVGKTWASLDWPNCYYMDAEGGANLPNYVEKLDNVCALYLGQEDGAADFDVLLGEIQSLATTKHDRKTLVVDSFSKVFENEVQAELDRMEAKGEKPAFGSEKKPAIKKSRRLIKRFDSLDMNVLLIMHEKAQWAQGEQVGWTFDGWDKLSYELNLVLQVVKQGGARKARVIKSRFESFTEGELVDWAYETFRERFGAEVVEADSTPTEPATQGQVDRINALVEATRFDEAKLAKWKEAAGVTDWREMDTETLAKCIAALEKHLPAAVA